VQIGGAVPTLEDDRAQQATLLRLARLDLDDLLAMLRELTRTDAETLGVARVGFWRFVDEGRAIVAAPTYDAATDTHQWGTVLVARDAPRYFSALHESRSIAAHDAQRDPRTRELRDGYLAPAGITSMLDVPIWREGRVVGILCHEHVGERRRWTPAEQRFATTVADFIARALEIDDRRRAERDRERALAELELRAAYWEQVVRAIADGVWIAASDGSIWYANAHGRPRRPGRDAGPHRGRARPDERVRRAGRGPPARRLAAGPGAAGRDRGGDAARDPGRPRRPGARGPDVGVADPGRAAGGLRRRGRHGARAVRADGGRVHRRRALVRQATAELAGITQTHRITVAEVEPSRVWGDEHLLAQVLTNLLTNAVKYSPPGSPVTVSLRRSGGRAAVSVTDRGIGIPADRLDRLFERFYRAHAGTRDDRSGLGVGLYLARDIARAHHGHIQVETEEGQGSTFTLWLPLLEPP
jgi:anti-sigma regulatory factor (Ser/Thr protein kinase)